MTKKAQKFRTLIVLAIVTMLSLGFFLFRGTEVVLHVDGTALAVVSNAKTVEELVEEENIIKEDAYIDTNLETEIEKGLEIQIKNPKPYTIDVNGLLTPITSTHTEVRQILEDAGVEIGEHDYTFPALDQEVAARTNIEYYHVDIVEEVKEDTIPFEEETRENKDLEKGKSRNVQEGKEGLKRREIQRTFLNGSQIERKVLSEEVVEEPIAHIDEYGSKEPEPVVVEKPKAQPKQSTQTKQAAQPNETRAAKQESQPSRGNSRKVITMNASAYDLSFESTGKRPGDRGYGITASGTQVRPGVVSVDPNVIPLGTRLYIESLDGTPDYGNAVAEDTGGAIKGNKIDLFFSSRNAALNFGRRNVRVHILD